MFSPTDPISKKLYDISRKILNTPTPEQPKKVVEEKDDPKQLLDEKWGNKYEASKKKRGMWQGKNSAEIEHSAEKLRHKDHRTAAQTSKLRAADFAVRAKHHWQGGVHAEEVEDKEGAKILGWSKSDLSSAKDKLLKKSTRNEIENSKLRKIDLLLKDKYGEKRGIKETSTGLDAEEKKFKAEETDNGLEGKHLPNHEKFGDESSPSTHKAEGENFAPRSFDPHPMSEPWGTKSSSTDKAFDSSERTHQNVPHVFESEKKMAKMLKGIVKGK